MRLKWLKDTLSINIQPHACFPDYLNIILHLDNTQKYEEHQSYRLISLPMHECSESLTHDAHRGVETIQILVALPEVARFLVPALDPQRISLI